MSSETPESSAAPEQSNAGGDKKRSPVERAIVWSLIGLMLVLVALEARAQQGHTKTMVALQEMVDEGKGVKYEDFTGKIELFPSVSDGTPGEGWDVYQYKWFSLLRSGRYEIHLRVSTGNDIKYVAGYAVPDGVSDELMFEAVRAPDGALPPPAEDAPDGMMVMPGGGGGGPGGGANGGEPGPNAGQRFDPEQAFANRDENGDGKLTGKELEGRFADRLVQLDTNKDGEISKEEFDAGMAARRESREAGGAPNGPGSRPPVDDDSKDENAKPEGS